MLLNVYWFELNYFLGPLSEMGYGLKNIKPVMLDTLAAMYVTCNMFLMHCFDFSKSNNDLSFQKVHFFKTKIIKTAEKEPY